MDWKHFEQIRNENLRKNLQELKIEIFERVDTSINKRIEHLKASPETSNKLSKLDVLCATRGEQIISMKDDITEIKDCVKEISGKIDEGLKLKADREEFIFWRNFLIGGMFLAIFMGAATLLIEKFSK